jgi:hypothetical protein
MSNKQNVIQERSEQEFFPDRAAFKDDQGAYLTQSLFLEVGYNKDRAIYTFNDEDKEYKGKIFKSLRKLYLETEDPTEYIFATRYLHGWDHWQRIVNNEILLERIEKWREELEVKLRSKGVRAMLSLTESNATAAKWAVDGLWARSKPGRKTAAQKRKEERVQKRVTDDTRDDVSRVTSIMRNKPANE